MKGKEKTEEKLNVGASFAGIPVRRDTTVPLKSQKGITLIALVITIVVLLILAGVTLSIVFNGGIINKSQTAVDSYSEQSAREKLEIELINMLAEKVTNPEYNKEEFLTEKLSQAKFGVIGNVVIVDGWQFQIDRNAPKIINSLGKGSKNEEIKIELSQEVSNDYTESTVTVKITYNGELKEININGEKINPIPDAVDGVYTITKEIKENKTVGVLVKDEEDNYNMGNIPVVDLTEDMIIDSAEKLAQFRNMVNTEGRTFENRKVTLTKDIDINSICYKVDGTVTNDKSWEPIGANGTIFAGTFDGGYYTIKNLYINTNSYQYVGLFGIIDNKAIIRNLYLYNAKVYGSYSTFNFVGGLVGRNDGEIINVGVFNGTIEATTTKSGTSTSSFILSASGGITGRNDGKIKQCYNGSNVIGKSTAISYDGSRVGGISGFSDGEIMDSYNIGRLSIETKGTDNSIGGITGINLSGTISNCYNIGNISSEKGTNIWIGGICGRAGYAIDSRGTITNCFCINATTYAFYYYTGSTTSPSIAGQTPTNTGVVSATTLQGCASNLGGTNWVEDTKGVNTYVYNNVTYTAPILKWQISENR